jgi:hypothetical protein
VQIAPHDQLAAASQTDLPQATAEEARALTDRIKVGVDAIWELIKQAYVTRAWSALGYGSWDDYCQREFGTSRIRLPREERQEVVASMREIGMSVRAIASASGVDAKTVRNALPTGENSPVGPRTITGVNGKTYQSTQPQRPKPAMARFECRACRGAFGIDRRGADGLCRDCDDNRGSFGDDELTPAARPAPGENLSLNPRDQFLDWTDEELQIRDRLNDGETVVISQRDNHARVLRWADARDQYVRVDRRTDWGNPFETPADGDRKTVIQNYAEHYLPYKPSLLDRLPDLRGKALGCWCAPLPCHADVLRARAAS